LQQIHDWVSSYQQSWSERFEQLDSVLADLKAADTGSADRSAKESGDGRNDA
jgi:hypothetical protein